MVRAPTPEEFQKAAEEAALQPRDAVAPEAPAAAIAKVSPPLCGCGDCLAYATHGWNVTVWPKNVPLESRGRGATISLGLYVCEHHAGQVTIASLMDKHWQDIEAWWATIEPVAFDRDTVALELVPLARHGRWQQQLREKARAAGTPEPNGGYQQSFVSQLRWEDLQKLRGAVRRVWQRKGMPDEMITEKLCDQVIEAMGPTTRERWLKQIVDKALHR